MDTPRRTPTTLTDHPSPARDDRPVSLELLFAIRMLVADAERIVAPGDGYPPHGEVCICPRCGLRKSLDRYHSVAREIDEWVR